MVGNNQRINSFLHNLFLGEEEMEALMFLLPLGGEYTQMILV